MVKHWVEKITNFVPYQFDINNSMKTCEYRFTLLFSSYILCTITKHVLCELTEMAEGLSLDEERAHNEPGKVLGPILIS